MESSFSSPRNDSFPAGLRVLVVDDDPTWLKILEKMLKKCSYEVTTCGLARDALNLLREKKDGYDIVISDVNMPDMDGFKLLEHVGLEMDLPVIMMSVDGETSRVMKGVQHGACDYLLKPIRMKELRNIWQHVFRKKIHEIRDIESHESIEGIHLIRNGSDQYEEGYFFSADDLSSSRKRKDVDNKYDDKDFSDCSSTKKARVVWSVDLHQKFVKAVHQIGFDKVGPKKILDLMNVPWLTRENVASHLQNEVDVATYHPNNGTHSLACKLMVDRSQSVIDNMFAWLIILIEKVPVQKYRLYLSRLQKENDLKSSFGGTKHSDYSSKDPQGIFNLQNSINIQQNDVAQGSYRFSGNNLVSLSVDPKSNEGDVKGIISEPVAKPKKGLTCSIPDSQKTRSSQVDFSSSYAETQKGLVGNVPDSQKIRSSQMCVSHSFASLESEVDLTAFDSSIPTSILGIRKEHKPLIQLNNNGFSKTPLPGPQPHFQADQLQPIPSVSSRPFIAKGDVTGPGPTNSKPSYSEYTNNHGSHVSPTISATDSMPDQSKSCAVDHQVSETISTSTSNMKNQQGFNLNCFTDLESAQRNLILGNASSFASLDDDFQVWYQGDCYGMNLEFDNVEFSECDDPSPVTEVPAHFYDALRFELPCDPSEYCVMDQGLFIA